MIAITIERPNLLPLDWVPYSPFVWYATTAFVAYVQPTRYDSSYDMTTPSLNDTPVDISTVYIDNIQQDVETSIVLCQGNEESFYMDIAAQRVYVHYNHRKRPLSSSFNSQQTIGYCSDRVFYDSNDFEFLPYVLSSATITDQSDRISAGKMSFKKQSIRLKNPDQHFNDFYDNAIPGALVKVKYISDKDLELGKKTLTDIYAGYSGKDTLSTIEYSITASDIREKYAKKIPSTYYTTGDNEVIPEGYGDCIGIKAVCLNPDTTGNGNFQYATDGTSITTVYEKDGDNWTAITPLSTDPANGTLVLTKTWTTGSPPTIKVDARLRDLDNPADIIQDITNRYYGDLFDSNNYEIEQWNSEKTYFEPVYLYMEENKETYKYFEELQKSSTYNFKLMPSPSGKLTIKVNDNERAISRTILAIDNIDMIRTATRDFTEYATTVKATYNHDYMSKTEQRIIVDTYEQEALDAYQIDQNLDITSNLTNLTDATAKADRIAAEYREVRHVINLKLNDLFPIQIYDILDIDNRFYEGNEIANEYIGQKTGKVLKVVYDFGQPSMMIQVLDITTI